MVGMQTIINMYCTWKQLPSSGHQVFLRTGLVNTALTNQHHQHRHHRCLQHRPSSRRSSASHWVLLLLLVAASGEYCTVLVRWWWWYVRTTNSEYDKKKGRICCCAVVVFFTSNRSGLNHITWLPIRYVVCWTRKIPREYLQSSNERMETKQNENKKWQKRNDNIKHMPEKR